LGPSSPLNDGGGSIHGWLLMAVCGWWWHSLPFIGGGGVPSSLFVVGAGGWWWCSCRHVGGAGCSSSFVGGAAGCSTLVIHVVIGHQLPLVFSCHLSIIVVVCCCALFIGVVIIQRHFILCGDMAADISVGLPIGEG